MNMLKMLIIPLIVSSLVSGQPHRSLLAYVMKLIAYKSHVESLSMITFEVVEAIFDLH